MAKKLQIAGIVSPTVGFPVKQGTWDFLQLAHQEEVEALVKTIIGSSYNDAVIYILWGCASSTSGGNTIIAPGAVFYNHEVFYCAGQTFTTGAAVVANMLATPYTTNADPVQFVNAPGSSGAPSANVHFTRTIVFSAGASGSGAFASQTSGGSTTGTVNDYNNMIIIINTPYLQNNYILNLIEGYPTVTSTYFGVKRYMDQVFISGTISLGTNSGVPSTLTYLTLNEGFRPLEDITVSCGIIRTHSGTTIIDAETITILSNGTINYIDSVGNSSILLCLSGINFRVY